jgi:hypothetical protein
LRKFTRRAAAAAAATVLAALLAGCAALPLPGGAARAEAAQRNLAALQAALQRYADEFMSRTTAALEEFARRAGTPDARSQALAWQLPVVSAAVGIASGPNPSANLLDLITLAAVTRRAVEELHAAAPDPAALQPWLEVSRTLEDDAWRLATGVLDEAQQQELRAAVERWWAATPDARGAFFARPQELGDFLRESAERTGRTTSVFGLVGLDPTAGLDPAVREVTRTRLFAERTLYTAQRLPFLLRWHAELLADQMLRQSQVALALTNTAALAESAGRLGLAAESVSLSVAQLPDRVAAEREALLGAFEVQEGRLRGLAGEFTRTLAATEQASASLHTTITAFDALMRRFGIGEPDASAPRNPDSPPFNILDYARTAEELTVMARELHTLLQAADAQAASPTLDRRLRELAAAVTRARADARADAKAVLNHAFLLAAGLVLLAFAAALAYRRLGRRSAGA